MIEPAALERAHWSRRMMNDGLRSIIGLGSPRLITSPAGHQARARWTITGPAGAVG